MKAKKFLITGGTGFIGRYLGEKLLSRGHYLTIVTRSPEKYSEKQAVNRNYIGWEGNLAAAIEETDVVINLAGENIGGRRWTDRAKKRIRESRIRTTRTLVGVMENAATKPELFISASGINIYSGKSDTFLDESAPPGDHFLAQVCVEWEKEAQRAADAGIRTAVPRIAMVLGEQGGALEKITLPFRFFAGGPLGSGSQYMPWIHINDLCNALVFPIGHKEISGPYNACSPNPVTMNHFAETIGRILNRPSFLRVPEFILKGILGEAAQMILDSLRTKPAVLQLAGFEFEFGDIEEALGDVL